MTPKEKALKLKQAFGYSSSDCDELDKTTLPESVATKCALIAVNEIIDLIDRVSDISGQYLKGTETGGYIDADKELEYWQAVKTELKK